ncbi:TenA family protein [uncultured Oxalicibacterium sp.]|uniref:TenA family protein n=1 Tax=uncultured Oxalicibacterium sp. TaxID=1168540 RepID=UPI0025CE6E5D|nr:TenA family protein [uncultured Oxalicibacterium sp.]
MNEASFEQRSDTSLRFTDWLREQNRANWDAATQHRFIDELFAGSVADDVLVHYLVQDYQFIDRFVALLGAAIASADRFESRVRLAHFAAMITSDENTYFLRSFDHLKVDARHRNMPTLTEPTKAFQNLMREAAESQVYSLCLSVLVVAEWLYLSWADRKHAALPPKFIHAEWITLHNNNAFADFVNWLRTELDRTGPAQDADTQRRSADMFARAVRLEREFFDHVYTPLQYD